MATMTYASIGDLRLSEALSAEYLRLLAAREALPNHPALIHSGDATGSGSSTIKLGHLGIDGYDLLASTGDGSTVTPTAHTDGSTTVTVARYSKAYAPTDLARLTDPSGLISPERFAVDALASANATLVNLIAALGSGFSNTVGASGSDATVQNFMDAKRQLNVSDAGGALMAVLHPQQWADVMDDLILNAGGAIQYDPAAPELIRVMGNGYQGSLAGVDVFTTTRIPTANAGDDRAGFMFARGAVVWADASPPVDDPTRQMLVGGKVLFEVDRDALAGLTNWVSHYYVGVAEGIDAAGVGIITDA